MSYRGTALNSHPAAFLVVLSTQSSNVTGMGANYSLGTGGGGAVTTIFDIGGNISTVAGALTFTAPVTGVYFFHACINFAGLTAAMNRLSLRITASSGFTSTNPFVNIGAVRDVNNAYSANATSLINLTAADTVTVAMDIQGGAGDTADIAAGGAPTTDPVTWFEGFLIA